MKTNEHCTPKCCISVSEFTVHRMKKTIPNCQEKTKGSLQGEFCRQECSLSAGTRPVSPATPPLWKRGRALIRRGEEAVNNSEPSSGLRAVCRWCLWLLNRSCRRPMVFMGSASGNTTDCRPKMPGPWWLCVSSTWAGFFLSLFPKWSSNSYIVLVI